MSMIREIVDLADQVIGERLITLLFQAMTACDSVVIEDRIPFDQRLDKVVYELPLKFGRADIVIYHVDGSASVIEVKDGSSGWRNVVAGIGQVGFYASQLAMSKGTLKSVRKCLLWTSTGKPQVDGLIEGVCNDAGVIPLPWGSLTNHLNATRACLDAIAAAEAPAGS